MKKLPFVLVFVASQGVFPCLLRAASFDCSKAQTPVEKAICADPHLSSLDDQMAAAYRKAVSQAGDRRLHYVRSSAHG